VKDRDGRRNTGGEPDIAIALSYDGSGAPRVTASGRNLLAESIIAAAEEAGVPLYPDEGLALVLAQIPLGEEIPEDLYRAIAEVIAFAYLLAGKFPEGFVPPADAD
jgi:flagellar biosynthesis protein